MLRIPLLLSALFCFMSLTVVGNAATTVGAPGEGADVLAQRHVATRDDNLVELAVQYDVGYIELVAANPGVDPWLPGAGQFACRCFIFFRMGPTKAS